MYLIKVAEVTCFVMMIMKLRLR